MAEHAHTTPAPTEGAPTTTSRRPLAAAVMAAIGVAFVRPASGEVVTIGRPDHDGGAPDAGLIALCSEFVEMELAIRAIYDGPGAILDDDAAELASGAFDGRMNALLDSLAAARAVTADGVLARATALAVYNGDFGFSFDHQDAMAGRLLADLLRDAAAISGRA